MSNLQRFGELIREARLRKGWDQETLGRAIGKDKGAVSRLEGGKGTHPPDPALFRSLWRVLAISPRTLVESLGYLDPEEMEPGVAYVIREDDPRTAVLALLEGASPTRVAGVAEVVRLFFLHSTSAQSDINSEGRHNRDQPDSA